MGKLIIVRHHESTWNKLGLWTGFKDVPLSEYGDLMSKKMGLLIKDIHIDHVFISTLIRSHETYYNIMNTLHDYDVPTEESSALNERDYGDYTGKDKWQLKELLGEEKWNAIRRGWDVPVPNGETLKMVYERVVPFFLKNILPILSANKNVLIVAHGNSIRALIKYIENISDEGISNVEMLFRGVLIYDLDKDGHMINKEVRQMESKINV